MSPMADVFGDQFLTPPIRRRRVDEIDSVVEGMVEKATHAIAFINGCLADLPGAKAKFRHL
jgi:hypothetical protein